MATAHGVYCIKNIVNRKVYVGSAVNLSARWRAHKSALAKGVHHSQHLQAAWGKYGEDAFVFEVVELVEHKTDLLLREQWWMDQYPRSAKYNVCVTAGSQLGRPVTEETRKKMSDSRQGKTHSRATKDKISTAQLGNKRGPHTGEKISAKLTGLKRSEEVRAAMSASRKGRKMPRDVVARLAEQRRGVPFSAAHKAALSRAKKLWYQALRKTSPDKLKQTKEHINRREASRMATFRLKQSLGLGYRDKLPNELLAVLQ